MLAALVSERLGSSTGPEASETSSYFESMYLRDPDPWSFRTRWYEIRKRAVTLAALPRTHYGDVFEPGCSNGALSAELATRCDHLLAMDVSPTALESAKAGTPSNVELVQGAVPDSWPSGRFDLVVISEIAYYFDLEDCQRLASLAVESAAELVAVHWRHRVEAYPQSGDEVHEILHQTAAHGGMSRIGSYQDDDFRLDVWSRDGDSVARRTGVPGS